MRVTYRTVRTISAIAENPGCSNRRVSDHAGVKDQGQVSKLLSRLEALGLIANDCERSTGATANAWRLTTRGVAFERAVRQA
jgi:DNA-binding MarR family transcriptional regulator